MGSRPRAPAQDGSAPAKEPPALPRPTRPIAGPRGPARPDDRQPLAQPQCRQLPGVEVFGWTVAHLWIAGEKAVTKLFVFAANGFKRLAGVLTYGRASPRTDPRLWARRHIDDDLLHALHIDRRRHPQDRDCHLIVIGLEHGGIRPPTPPEGRHNADAPRRPPFEPGRPGIHPSHPTPHTGTFSHLEPGRRALRRGRTSPATSCLGQIGGACRQLAKPIDRAGRSARRKK